MKYSIWFVSLFLLCSKLDGDSLSHYQASFKEDAWTEVSDVPSAEVVEIDCFNEVIDGSFQAKKKKKTNPAPQYKHYLSLCAIFQNEAIFLREWIEYHKLVGVEHFYLYNNLSTDDYLSVLIPYIEQGVVTLIEWPKPTNPDGGNWPTIQCQAYNDALNRSRRVTKWLAIIDTDEFVVPVETDSLTTFLAAYESYASIALNWQLFGTSHVNVIPHDRLMIELLTMKAPHDYPGNSHVKCIVQPAFVKACWSPHFCFLLNNHQQVDTNKQPFSGASSPAVLTDRARVNHYWSRTEDFFWNVKVPRRNKWLEGTSGCIKRNNDCNQEYDDVILKFAPELRVKMHLN